ncbi:MAG: hypothetical protein OEW19_02505 [Acidobacteriota bacterium]|nr:hypothetical protein [Acidobacteriota bacterium]
MRVALGADDAWVELEDALRAELDALGVTHEDFGIHGPASVHYLNLAAAVARGDQRQALRSQHPGLRQRHRHGDGRQDGAGNQGREGRVRKTHDAETRAQSHDATGR